VPAARWAITLPLPFVSPRECIEIARRAEEEWGYDAIWLAETNGPDSFSLAGAVAMTTSRVTIGTAIVPVYNRTPSVLAMSAASVAGLSGDRFVLGLGSSSHAIVRDWNGLPFERPLAHVAESVAILRQALAGERTDFEGEVLRSRGLRLGFRPARPVPIYLAALRERMLHLAGEIGDGLILNLFPVTALPQMLTAWRGGGAAVGRDVSGQEVVCRFQVAVTDDVASARGLMRLAFGAYLAAPVYNRFLAWCGLEDEMAAIAAAFARGDRGGVAAAMDDEVVDRLAILGPADVCRAKIAAFVDAGVTTAVVSPLATSRDAVLRILEALAPARG
jgi:probable F420-dependent oxidoreductase